MALLANLQRATHVTGAWLDASLQSEGLSHGEANLLAFLNDHPHAAINDAHVHFGHRRSTLTSLLDRLEARGLVRRVPHPSSRRSVSLELTDGGRILAGDVTELIEWLEDRVRQSVSTSDLASFDRVIRALEASTQ